MELCRSSSLQVPSKRAYRILTAPPTQRARWRPCCIAGGSWTADRPKFLETPATRGKPDKFKKCYPLEIPFQPSCTKTALVDSSLQKCTWVGCALLNFVDLHLDLVPSLVFMLRIVEVIFGLTVLARLPQANFTNRV